MSAAAEVRRLLEEALDAGVGPETACRAHPQHLEEVRRRWLRIRELAGDLERAFPSGGAAAPSAIGAAPERPFDRAAIPGYELEEVIGRGGMGVVYRATQLRLKRTVAVKMLPSGGPAPAGGLANLLREACTAAALRHPNIVEVYDAGEAAGLPWFAMEFLAGGSLADRLRGTPVAPREAAALVETLAAAVQAAHEKGIVHRDLKPANVLMAGDTPKISDFGLARHLAPDSQRTAGGARFGTPSYMAPEQARGTPEAFHPAVDVYALGAILYEMLTGRPPFRADSPLETQRQVITEEPVAPSRINRRVPRDLDTICLVCLQKSAAARYPSAAELARDLRCHLAGEPIAASRPAALVRAFKWSRRHPAATTAMGSAMVMIVAAVVGASWWLATAAATRGEVEGHLADAERAQRAADWNGATAALDRASARLGADGPADLRSRLDAGRRNEAAVESLAGIRLARALASGEPEAIARTDRDYAELYRDACGVTGDEAPEAAARMLVESAIGAALVAGLYDWHVCVADGSRRDWILAAVRSADTDHGGWRDRARDPRAWKDREAIARLLAESRVDGQPPEFLLWFAQLVKECGLDPLPLLRRIQAAHAGDFWANYVLGEALHQRGLEAEALRFLQAAMALRPEVALVHGLVGNGLRILGRFDEAIERLEAAVRLDPAAPAIRGNLAVALDSVGRHADSLPHVELAVRQWPDNAQLRTHLGGVLAATGRQEDALEQLRRAAELAPRTAAAREALVTEMIRAGRGPEAVAMCRSWLDAGPPGFDPWDGFAELCLFAGSKEDYEVARTRLLSGFGASTDPVVCERVGLASLLAPASEDEQRMAAAALDRALEVVPPGRSPWLRIGKALAAYRAGDAAAGLRLLDAETSRQVRPMPQLVKALCLAEAGRDEEALSELGLAGALCDWRIRAADNREAWICHVLRREAESALLPSLDAFVSGAWWPVLERERLAFLAVSESRGRHLDAARLFREAMAGDPGLERVRDARCRYRAACAAARAGGEWPEPETAGGPEQAVWREQAREWLRAELAAFRGLPSGTARSVALSQWLTEPDLRGIRDPALLAALPEDERAACATLWSEVRALMAYRDRR